MVACRLPDEDIATQFLHTTHAEWQVQRPLEIGEIEDRRDVSAFCTMANQARAASHGAKH
jgi:hypothetical protein